MKVVLVAFQGAVGPLVDQSWERTSRREDGLVIFRAYLLDEPEPGPNPVDGM